MRDVAFTRRQLMISGGAAAAALLAACSGSTPRAATDVPPVPSSTVARVDAPAPSTPVGPGSTVTPTAPSAPTTVPAAAITVPATSVVVPGAPATFVDHGTSTDAIALTFHFAGSPKLVAKLLDLLKERSVSVTALAVGSWLSAHPDLGHRLVDEGHELGNHTQNHKDMANLSAQQVFDEISQCGQALIPFVGSIGTWFRPSATVIPGQTILDQAGLAGYAYSIGYDVDSVDNKDPGTATIVSNVQRGVHPGSIVSMHFGHQGTIDALPKILDHLAANAMSPVTLTGLLG